MNALQNSPFNLVKTAGGIADLARQVYNDPVGSVSRGIAGLGTFAKDAYNNMARGAMGDSEAVGPGFMAAASILPTNAAVGARLPPGAVGSLIGIRGQGVNIAKAYDEYKRVRSLGGTAEDAFNASAKLTPKDASGIMRIMGHPVMEMYDPGELKTASVMDRVKSGVFGKDLSKPIPLSDLVKDGPTLRAYPDLARVMVQPRNMYMYDNGTLGRYIPPLSSIPGVPSSLSQHFSPGGQYGKIEVNSPMVQSPLQTLTNYIDYGRPTRWEDEGFNKTLWHEITHGIANTGDFPQGTNENYVRALIEAKNPSRKVSDNETWTYYSNDPGEVVARQVGDRLNISPTNIKNWDYRFTAPRADAQEIDYVVSDPDYRYGYSLPWAD